MTHKVKHMVSIIGLSGTNSPKLCLVQKPPNKLHIVMSDRLSTENTQLYFQDAQIKYSFGN